MISSSYTYASTNGGGGGMPMAASRPGSDSIPLRVAVRTKKRLIVCCDGTWMDSDNGFVRPTLRHPKGTMQIPSNVTRISRCFKRRCSDGSLQIISYESGVGTGSGAMDTITGGVFGLGLSERVHEAYSYLCANYTDGDEIILVGFSRGAFTVRSVAGMVANLGLLTREGVESFTPIFKDMQHWHDDDYKDPFPRTPFPRKPKGPHAAHEYRRRLEKMGLTRVVQRSGDLIRVKAVCVWDTVGSLGVPNIALLDKYKWHDTDLSDRIEHAFQALALDETRGPFSPAVWERQPQNQLTTDLRQVWFPGNHGNCGGGWEDQGMSNITLAWMMDQLASIGVEFDPASLDRIIDNTFEFYETEGVDQERKGAGPPPKWAVEEIYRKNRPIRPWGLGAIQRTTGVLFWLGGNSPRTPGMYRQTDPDTELDKGTFLRDTNERIHSSVRIRLACEGLALNDRGTWSCRALSKWRMKRISPRHRGPPSWEPNGRYGRRRSSSRRSMGGAGDMERWVWEYAGPDRGAPKQRVMMEEPIGPYERHLLRVTGGRPNVFEYADRKASGRRSRRSRAYHDDMEVDYRSGRH